MLKVITFNVWGTYGPEPGKRWDYAADCLKKLGPDILCLQEATDPALLRKLAKTLKLEVLLSDCASTGLAVASRIRAFSQGLIPYRTRSPLESYQRKYQWVQFSLKEKVFYLANTHLSWKKEDDATRKKQAEELSRWANDEEEAVLLCGDFNCGYSSPPLGVFRKRAFQDLLGKTPDAKKPSWDNQNPYIRSHKVKFPDRRIDLVLANAVFLNNFPFREGKIALQDPSKNGLYPSDHYAVMTSFKI